MTVDVAMKCTAALVDCDPDAGHTLTDLYDISAVLTFGDEVVAGTGVNLGLDGLPLSVEAGVEAFADWSVTVGAGVSREDGPYIALDPDAGEEGDEVSVTAGVRFNDQGPADCAGTIAESVPDGYVHRGSLPPWPARVLVRHRDRRGRSGSNITATSGSTSPDPTPDRITLADILGGDLDVDFTLGGEVHLAMHIRTGIGEDVPDIPTVLGTFHLDWAVEVGEDIEPPTIGFDDLHLDLGTFLSGFLEPIAKEVKNITGPLQPIIDVLMAPIPVVSDLAELVGADPITMISLLEAATGRGPVAREGGRRVHHLLQRHRRARRPIDPDPARPARCKD